MTDSSRVRWKAFAPDSALGWTLGVVSAGLAVRLLVLVRRYSVNLLFWDEWDYLHYLWPGHTHGFWPSFTLLFGPIRMGIGLNLIEAVLQLTRWDTRMLAYVHAGFFILSCGGVLALKRRLFGHWAWPDVMIPAVLLSLSQTAPLFWVRNLPHG